MRCLRIVILTTALITVGGIGCSPDDRDGDHTRTLRHCYALIDQGREDQAINELEPILAAEPENLNVRLALASAYVSRSGIRILQFMDFFRLILDPLKARGAHFESLEKGLFAKLESYAGNENEKRSIEITKAVYKAVWYIDDFLNKYEKIPIPPQVHLGDLETALLIMEQAADISGGPALYRGTLRLVLAKSYWKYEIYFASVHSCQPSLTSFREELWTVKNDLDALFDDFSLGMTKDDDKNAIAVGLERFDEHFAELDTYILVHDMFDRDLDRVLDLAFDSCQDGRP